MSSMLNALRDALVAGSGGSQALEQREKLKTALSIVNLAARVGAICLAAIALVTFSVLGCLLLLPIAYVFWEVSVMAGNVNKILDDAGTELATRISQNAFASHLTKGTPLFRIIHQCLMARPDYSTAFGRVHRQYATFRG